VYSYKDSFERSLQGPTPGKKKVNSTNVRELGNLLQGAVQENKKDFVKILLEFGVDPNRAAEGCQKTPIDIAIRNVIFSNCFKGGFFSILMLLAGKGEIINIHPPPY